MTRTFSRRAFLAGAAATAWSWRRAHVPCASIALRVGFLDTNTLTAGDRINGATLGVEEARHAAAMFGGTISLQRFADVERVPVDVVALLGDEDESRCGELAGRAGQNHQLFFNIACSSDALRGAQCSASTFHIAPSNAMCRAARMAVKASVSADVVVWDSTLARFGADTLNERYARRFDTPMRPAAWTAWLAMKVLWETSLKTRTTDAMRLAAALVTDTTQFDGHKGRPLSFRPWDRQLRQPLYVRTPSTLAEAPRPTGEDESSRDVLDELGATEHDSSCHTR